MQKKTRQKPIPTFRSEAEARKFWATHDSADYIDWSASGPAVFPDLRPSTERVSLNTRKPKTGKK